MKYSLEKHHKKFSLPEGWTFVKLEKVGNISGGGTPATNNLLFWEGTIPWLVPSDVTANGNLYMHQTSRNITSEGLANSSAKLLPAGSVLMTSRATIGEVAINTVPMATNQGFINIICDEELILNTWLAFWIMHKKPVLEERGHGVTFRELSKSNFKSIELLLPPLPEQHAIASTLRTVQDAIQARQRELELERERKAALMQTLFSKGTRGEPTKMTKIGEMPEGWEITKLGNVFETQLGKMLSKAAKKGIAARPYIRNANVQWGFIDYKDLLEMDFSDKEKTKFRLKYGDILVCEGGEIGRTAIWRNQIEECYFQKAIHRLRPRQGDMLPEFFLYYMERSFLLENVYGIAGTETTIAHLPQEKLQAMFIAKPSFIEQKSIAGIIGTCDTKIAALEREIALHEELFRTLLEELMTGRIRVPELDRDA